MVERFIREALPLEEESLSKLISRDRVLVLDIKHNVVRELISGRRNGGLGIDVEAARQVVGNRKMSFGFRCHNFVDEVGFSLDAGSRVLAIILDLDLDRMRRAFKAM